MICPQKAGQINKSIIGFCPNTTIHKFENGTAGNLSLSTFLLLLKAIGQINYLDDLLPESPVSPFLMRRNEKKAQRIRHKILRKQDGFMIIIRHKEKEDEVNVCQGLCKRVKHKACFSVLQRVQPRLAKGSRQKDVLC